ncbi:MAG: hypothetical protein ACP5VR_05480 [Acidimicrobiales bacterium]
MTISSFRITKLAASSLRITKLAALGRASRSVPALVLGAASLTWAAVPTSQAGTGGALVLAVASACLVAGSARLAWARRPPGKPELFAKPLERAANHARSALAALPWETVAAVAIVVLEALHPARPWHTGVLAMVLTGYLLAVHRGEAYTSPHLALRRQAGALVLAGVSVVVLTGLACVPGATNGPLSPALEVLACAAALLAGAMAVVFQ